MESVITCPVLTKEEEFIRDFFPLLGHTARWQAFSFIAKEILAQKRPAIIVETGTLRLSGNWDGDGQSTRVWDYLAAKTGGVAISVDINIDSCQLAAKICPHTRVVVDDSVTALRGYLPAGIQLLYLDAYDYKPGSEVCSMMHHAAELASAWEQLPSGALIAVDDCHNDNSGKHAMVKLMLKSLGITPILEGYITIWRKP